MKLPTLAKVCGARNRLQAERDSLLAANVALREALQNLADYTARISPPPYEHGCMWCAGCVERLNGEVRTALANPATTEALERVKREAQAEVLEEVIGAIEKVSATYAAYMAEMKAKHATALLKDKLRELRGQR